MRLSDLAAACEATDGVSPFNEATRLSAATGEMPRVVVERGDAAAIAFGDAPSELAVHPDQRLLGIGTQLLTELIRQGERRLWAHGDLPGAQHLAASVGATAIRTLLVLRRGTGPIAVPQGPPGVTIRPANESDVDGVIEVNAAAFADHPEQGAMDRADFDRRASQPWFDLAGLFVAVREDKIVGFHWTKLEGDIGEVYVVGVEPSMQGTGLGSALTAVGVDLLISRGATAIDLYVEGDNAAALAVYHRLGFTEHIRDVLYALR